MSGTRVTAVDVDDAATEQTAEIRDDYVLITDGSARVDSIQTYDNGTHVITIKGVRR